MHRELRRDAPELRARLQDVEQPGGEDRDVHVLPREREEDRTEPERRAVIACALRRAASQGGGAVWRAAYVSAAIVSTCGVLLCRTTFCSDKRRAHSMMTLLTSKHWKRWRKSRPAIVCGSSLAAGTENGTETLPSAVAVKMCFGSADMFGAAAMASGAVLYVHWEPLAA